VKCESRFIAHHRDYDGKEQSLEQHLIGVANKSRLAARKIGLEKAGELIGLLHDLGKYSDAFQRYLKSAVGLLNQDVDEGFVDAKGLKGKIDHSTAGAQLIWQELSKQGNFGAIAGQILALCVASHHSGLIDSIGGAGEDIFSKRMNKSDSKVHLNESMRNMDVSIDTQFKALVTNPDITANVMTVIKTIVISNRDVGESVVCQKVGLLVRMLFSCLIDADRLDSADFERPRSAQYRLNGGYENWDVLIDRLEQHLATMKVVHPIDVLRQNISSHCLAGALKPRGIYTLSVPTGGGKTLASLRFALKHAGKHGMDRILYVIPFTSIIDQNAKVVRDIMETEGVERGSILLEHHSNLTPEAQSWRDKLLAENWDAPMVYTTMVQFLETLFGGGTRGARRMHQLANSVLIFDEIQTLPVSCIHLFNNAINFLVEQCNSTVVLCTATQPLLDKVDSKKGAIKLTEESELMPDVKQLFADLKRVEVKNSRKPGGWSQNEIADLAMSEADVSGSCLVIVNTKKAAQDIYQLCSEQSGLYIVYHLSTSMCPAHRKVDLEAIRQHLDEDHHDPMICISTQLIEAGVDVDFGSVIRFAAGLDSIAQAAGRCNRNGKRGTATVHVVNPTEENLGMLKDIKVGKEKAERVLDDFDKNPNKYGNDRIGPEAMHWYYENYFFSRKNEMDYPVSANENGRDDSLFNMLSINYFAVHEYGQRHGHAPNIYLRQSFMSAAKAFKAIDAPTQGVIVPYGKKGEKLIADLCGAFEVEKQYRLLRDAQQFTVNVFSSTLKKLQQAGAVYSIQDGVDILHLDPRYYSKTFGLSTEPVERMEACIG